MPVGGVFTILSTFGWRENEDINFENELRLVRILHETIFYFTFL